MLIHTTCPIDGSDDADIEVYPANFDLCQIDANIFSARRMPDHIHYRMVRNSRTRCLRADPILPEEVILNLYSESKLTYGAVAPLAVETYAEYTLDTLSSLPDRRGILEIGCGDGAFLERAKDMGFDLIAGVEPSKDAVDKACHDIKDHIHEGVLRRGTFLNESFSLICGFQVLDHLISPNDTLQICWDLLAPGGIMLWICHDIRSTPARLLGRHCPMIDIEHVVLYDRETIAALFAKNGFEVKEVFGVANSYPLTYWLHISPLPKPLKLSLIKLLKNVGLEHWKIRISLGNMGIIAYKPPENS